MQTAVTSRYGISKEKRFLAVNLGYSFFECDACMSYGVLSKAAVIRVTFSNLRPWEARINHLKSIQLQNVRFLFKHDFEI